MSPSMFVHFLLLSLSYNFRCAQWRGAAAAVVAAAETRETVSVCEAFHFVGIAIASFQNKPQCT
jgi:hypothetical protein